MISEPSDCNVYAVRCGPTWVVIDSGAGLDPIPIAANLGAAGIGIGDVAEILLTHAHFDHSGNASWLSDRLGAALTAPSTSADALETADEESIHLPMFRRLGFYPAAARMRPARVSRRVAEGDAWAVGDATLRVVATPGHSRDSVSYLVETPDGLLAFVGDLVFEGGRVLLSPLPECDPFALGRSIRELAGWPIVGLYPGHGASCPVDGLGPIREALGPLDRMVVPPNLL